MQGSRAGHGALVYSIARLCTSLTKLCVPNFPYQIRACISSGRREGNQPPKTCLLSSLVHCPLQHHRTGIGSLDLDRWMMDRIVRKSDRASAGEAGPAETEARPPKEEAVVERRRRLSADPHDPPPPGHHQRRAVRCRSSHTSKANPPPHAKMTEQGSCKLG